MLDFILILIIGLIVGASAAYIIKAKRNGTKCIGCPMKECNGSCSANSLKSSCSSCKKNCK